MLGSLFNASLLNDPGLNTASVMALEKLLNKALQYDPATRQKLKRLENTWIHINTDKPHLDIYFSVVENQFQLRSHFEDNVDATISGDFIDFIKLSNTQHSLSDSSLHVSGKSGLLTEMQTIFSGLDVDWEEALCNMIGIVPGHVVAQSIRAAMQTANSAKTTVEMHFADFLSEELQAIPSKSELEFFYNEVDELSAHVQRIEARLNRLSTHIPTNKK